MTAYHMPSLPLLIVALLDVVMLAVLVTHTVWRQRLVQLIIVAICTLCFAMLFVLAPYKLLNSYYSRDRLVLSTISLCLTAASSATALVYLIIAITRPQTPARPLSALAAHAGPSPLPPVPLPPIPPTGWPASFYFFQLLSIVKLGAAGTGLFYSTTSAFGSHDVGSSPIDYRPAVPPA